MARFDSPSEHFVTAIKHVYISRPIIVHLVETLVQAQAIEKRDDSGSVQLLVLVVVHR